MRPPVFLIVFLQTILVISCRQTVETELLRSVELCVDTHPDSALCLLKQICWSEKLRGQQRADYALLLTQAQDKNFLDSLQSDSLVKIAVDYFCKSKDPVKAGKALFYQGKLMAVEGNDSVALLAYLEAETWLEQTNEYATRAFVHEYIGYLHKDRKAYKDSLSPVFPSLLQLLGNSEKDSGNYLEAVDHFRLAIKYERVSQTRFYYYLSLGDTYCRMKRLEVAENCFVYL